jgi:hypothetical protein
MLLPRDGLLPRLKVQVLPDGRIEAGRRDGAFQPTDERWWNDVLLDPRARVPTETSLAADGPHARYRLDRQPLTVEVACRCGRSTSFDRDKLIAQVGGDMNAVTLAREMINCGQRNKVDNYCRAYVIQ